MSLFFPDGLEFYPKHPSPIKTHKIQTSPMPMLEGQTAPFEAAELCAKFENDLNGCLAGMLIDWVKEKESRDKEKTLIYLSAIIKTAIDSLKLYAKDVSKLV